jgi:hypothetical protein
VTLHVKRTPGEGRWEGMTLLAIQADAVTEGRPVRMDFSRYVAANSGRVK